VFFEKKRLAGANADGFEDGHAVAHGAIGHG
jgi:hypothetical protein